MRRAAVLMAAVGLAALAAAVALARVGEAPGARAGAIAAAGDFSLSSATGGMPIFAAAGIGPGDSARGTVEVADTGSLPVELTLRRHDLLDSPGLGGGLLSGALALTVADVTDPATPVAIYSGPLDSMPDQRAGRLGPGASRRYEFVATLPAAGPAVDQNAVQGASVSVAYSWTASEVEAEPEPEVGPGPEASPSQASAAPDRDGLDLALIRAARSLRGGKLVVWARCASPCAIAVRGRLTATAGRHRRGAKVRFAKLGHYLAGNQRLRIPVPARLRRWLAAAPGKRRLRAKLAFAAADPLDRRAALRRALALRPPRRR
ncbi:MAG TPA: hypothetical protein VGI73_00310 [Solirubrobacterales bacterium]|jgi:hypothetical protein